jgi:signal transduction histidine kinase
MTHPVRVVVAGGASTGDESGGADGGAASPVVAALRARQDVEVVDGDPTEPAVLADVDCLVATPTDTAAVGTATVRDPPIPTVLAGRDVRVVPASPAARDGDRTGDGIAIERVRTVVERAVEAAAGDGPTGPDVADAGQSGRADGDVRSLYRTTRDLMRAADRETVARLVVDSAESVLALPITGVHLATDGVLVPTATTGAVDDIFGVGGPTYAVDGDGVVAEVFRDGDPELVSDAKARGMETPMESGVVYPLGDHGVLITSSKEAERFDEGSLRRVELLGASARAALDRIERERRLNALHGASRRLMAAEDVDAVAAAAVDAAADLLGLDVSAVLFPSDDGTELVPRVASAAARDLLGDGPVGAGPDESAAGRAFSTGAPLTLSDVEEGSPIRDPDGPVRSGMAFPLDDRSVFLLGTTDPGGFDDDAHTVANVLASNVAAALARARREETLRERERRLERQNERLDEFASVVSHDFRSPLTVARGRLALARETCSAAVDEQLAAVADAHDRMEALVDGLLTLARQGRAVGDTEPVALAPLATAAAAEVSGVALEATDVVVEADPDRLRELVGNLVRNAAAHAGDDVRVSVGPLDDADADDAGDDAPTGFYVADDGPGIPPGDRETVFERGYTTGADGTGLGLSIVRRVAEAHGWRVSVTEGADGGARFEVRTRTDADA